jgi:hypothetical protein
VAGFDGHVTGGGARRRLSPRSEERGQMRIDDYRFGNITIDGRSYEKDVLLLPPRVLSPWWRKQGHRLDVADLDEVLAHAPEVLVVGSGAHGGMKVPGATVTRLESVGIGVEVAPTEQACRRFGELLADGRRVAGAFHLTC